MPEMIFSNFGGKYDNETNYPHFFHIPFELYLFLYLLFAFQDLKNSISCGPPFALCSGMLNTFHAKVCTLKPVNIDKKSC